MRTALLTAAVLGVALAGCDTAHHHAPADLRPIAGWRGTDVNAPDAFRFVVLSDRTGGHEEGAWARAVAETNLLRPDFVMSVGDFIEGYTKNEAKALAEWEEFDGLTAKLKAPFFYCPGNHDIAHDATRKVYTARHARNGKTYYSFNYRGCHFVVLDSTAIVNAVQTVDAAQWAWLEKDLKAAAGARHVFLFMHHPIYGGSQWQRLRKLLPSGRSTVFAGHYHNLSFDHEDGIPCYILGRTAAKVGEPSRDKGGYQMYAHVAVSKGDATVSVLPVGEVRPAEYISRALEKRVRLLRSAVSITAVTRAGGTCITTISNTGDVDATFTLQWTGEAKFFTGGLPKPALVSVPAGEAVTRKLPVLPTVTSLLPPTLEIEYTLVHDGQTGKGTQKLDLPVAAVFSAGRVKGVKIDGKLGDWAGVAPVMADSRATMREKPEAWDGPKDHALALRVGYDDQSLYLAMKVVDEKLVPVGRAAWSRDGVEVFWDPRPAREQTGRFAGVCRQLLIPIPAEGETFELVTRPADPAMGKAIRKAWSRTTDGYVVELAVPLEMVAKGFRPAPGVTLRLEVLSNDLDSLEPKSPISCAVISGGSDASKTTSGYAIVKFK